MASSTRTPFDPQSPAVRRLIDKMGTPWKFRLYTLSRLPSLAFWSVRVKSISPERCEITLPYGWRTQNPFRSIYFAAQCGAAELSTGLLSILSIEGRGRISMLITKVEAEFIKKADQLTTFTCEEGPAIREAVQRAIESGEGEEIRVLSTGVQADGKVVSRLYFTWSFKVKD